ncbi:DoxX family protein [Endozoicomonadaceae bacterium StTr2]
MNKANSAWSTLVGLNESLSGLLNYLQPVALLAARLYVAWVFFASGLTKIDDWETTLFLFELEYEVPLLSPVVAAWLGTAGELIFPVLLAFGLFGRVGALGLSAVNVVAVLSLSEMAPAAFNLHVIWGLLLAVVALWGAGKISVDTFLSARK